MRTKGEVLYEDALALEKAGKLHMALDAFKGSLRADPKKSAPWIGLGRVLDKNQQHAEALQCYQHACAAEPQNPSARVRLGQALSDAGKTDEAERAFKLALDTDPAHAAAYHGLGSVYEDCGRASDAATAYRKCLRLDENASQTLGNLLGLGRQIDVDDAIEMARNQLKDLHHDGDIALIAYGLGKELERRGEYAEAFESYRQASEARKQVTGHFNKEAFDKRIEAICNVFTQDFFRSRAGYGDSSTIPIFIVGLPRSGTTLTEQILASHPTCFGAGEIDALSDLATGTPDRLGRTDVFWPLCAPQLTAKHVQDIAEDYLNRLTAGAPDTAVRVIDKQPLNFFQLGLVRLALPKAKIIHCARDIRDNGLSIYSENFAPSQRWSIDLEDIAHYWHGYRRLMTHWKGVLGDEMLTQHYEQTVDDTEKSSRRLLEFAGLPWDPACLQFHKNDRAVQTPSRWQVRQPIYKRSAGRWSHFEEFITPLTQAWNSSSS